MAKFRIGELDQEIQIYRWVRTPDGQGGFTRSATLQHTLMAKLMSKGGGENFRFEKVEAVATFTFVIRNLGLDIREDDYILFNGEQYNIRNILNKNTRDLYLQIEAERGVAQ
ncbi:MAG: head-tail adaptor protein [Nitrospinaceae bacterium]|nr:head-tail adaptor protein [Nitrospinaceae bacterium]NIR55607.1 head-tail adaptor protein [Nitrospinaceae bacterium]NIS86041.1 head-tail adaptor protein [Nitrospinaceae bacterium]NIT82884.1 head-tail adaptor protein [Nitrospinaceae bacterium]NIU45089.1 head-tail adaptor protein [Nitrospinaceae bacterium]